MSITLTEINGTFDALKKTAGYLEENWAPIENFIKGKKRFVFTGSGSSYSLAKSMAVIANMETGIPSLAAAAGDLLLHADRYAKCFDGAALVCVSRSGKTSEALKALDALRLQNSVFSTASHVCADDTPLAAKSDLTVSTPWAFDNSVCQTRSVSNFYFTAAYIAAKHTGNKALLDDLRHVMENTGYLQKAEKLADELSEKPWNHCVVLADAELEGIAEEGALAFKEICRLPSSYYHLLDVRHGPVVLIGEKTLVLAALGSKNELEAKLIADLKKKGAEVVAFSDTPLDFASIDYGHDLSHIARGIPFILLCQMTAYKKSLKTGADPDKPEGLDPWIAL